MRTWEKIKISTSQGEITGIAPVIISASRATDIPAFYSDWFFERLDVGYLKWINPFNRKAQYVSLRKVRAIVFWTKNPFPIIRRLEELKKRDINYYFMVTVNDYEDEGLEPGLPSLNKRMESFILLSELLGKERVIWRYDPLIQTEKITVEKLMDKISNIGNNIHKHTEQLVFSFADIDCYSKVKARLARRDIKWKPFEELAVIKVAEELRSMNKNWGLSLRTCAEDIDLSSFGIIKNRCIDGELMRRLFFHDKQLMKFLGVQETIQISLLNETHETDLKIKDPGQRKGCGCIFSKDIGQYDTCAHRCVYCYATSSNNNVMRNLALHNRFGESIV